MLKVNFIRRPIVTDAPVTVAPVTVASAIDVGGVPVVNVKVALASPAAYVTPAAFARVLEETKNVYEPATSGTK